MFVIDFGHAKINNVIVPQKIVNQAIEYIKETIEPEKIYLFGSYATGKQTEKSDLDFFIIKETFLPKHKRALPLYSLGKTQKIGFPISVDFIVCTPQEFEQQKDEINSIAGEVMRTGRLVYAR